MNKTYVIGDLHGCYDDFIALSNQIGISENDLVISLGDIVDRGNKSLELYHYFKTRKNAIVLMGNHERKHLRGILSYSQEIVKVQFANEYEEFVEWTKSLPYFYETEDAIIVHAFFEHDVKLRDQKEEVLAGTTAGSKYLENKYGEGNYWSDFYTGSKPIIYGHHVVGDDPKIKNNTFGIDTGACHAGKLTIIELPGFKIHQIDVVTDYWKAEQAKWQIPVLNAKNWEGMKIELIHKQIAKLTYKQEIEVQEFLSILNNWIQKVEELIETIQTEFGKLVNKLEKVHPENFNQIVVKMKLRTYIFKAKTGNLTLDNLQKTLDTPYKVLNLATELQIKNLPIRKQ